MKKVYQGSQEEIKCILSPPTMVNQIEIVYDEKGEKIVGWRNLGWKPLNFLSDTFELHFMRSEGTPDPPYPITGDGTYTEQEGIS